MSTLVLHYRAPNLFITKSSKSTTWKEQAFEHMGDNFKPHTSCAPPSYDKRYSSLKHRKYFLAINLHNNQEILPQMLGNIIELIAYIPPANLYLSIYESGSSDETKAILKKFIEVIVPLKLKYEIFTSPLHKTSQMNRIEYLAYVRNMALEPLFKEIEVLSANAKFSLNTQIYDTVLFLNDVYYCVNDVLELFYQQALNEADMAAGMDYDAPNGLPHIYDTWVTHLPSGRNAKKEFLDKISDDPLTNDRIQNLLPVQMSCVWNGIVAMSIEPFLSGIRFRRGNNVKAKQKEPGECAGSECSTLCLDFHRYGFSRIIMVPRVKVAYEGWIYNKLKVERNQFTEKFPNNQVRNPNEDVPIDFKEPPSEFECWPYLDGNRGRDPNIEFAYMEPLEIEL